MRKIGIFGGSFDPVHEGHIHLAKLAKDAAELDQVWFLPCRVSPHKAAHPPSSGESRIRWLRIVLRCIPWASIETLELDREGPSFSYKTLEILKARDPENDWFWIMGGDQWNALETWTKPEELAKNVTFIVLARDGEKISPRSGYRLQIIHGEHPASSSVIRESMKNGAAQIPYLHPEIAREIGLLEKTSL